MVSCHERYELSKADTQMAKGIAIIGMVMLHLFCRLGNLPYTPLIYIGGKPLVYYLGLFGDMCVTIYCFCSGYAHYLLRDKEQGSYIRQIPKRLLKFLTNYWVVLILFSVLGIFFDKTGKIPGSIGTFLGNVLLYDLSYNGAWWFVATYVLLSLLSPLLYQITKKVPAVWLVIFSGGIYLGAYLFRYVVSLQFENPVLSWFWNQIMLLGTSQFGYVIGMVFRKNMYISKLRECVHSKDRKARNVFGGGTPWRTGCILLPVALFLLHCVEPSLIIAPITGLGTIVCFWMWKKPQWLQTLCLFLGKHSTNIWLTHMFFYGVLFKDLVFVAKYPALIFLLMISICLCVSILIYWLLDLPKKYLAPKVDTAGQ